MVDTVKLDLGHTPIYFANIVGLQARASGSATYLKKRQVRTMPRRKQDGGMSTVATLKRPFDAVPGFVGKTVNACDHD